MTQLGVLVLATLFGISVADIPCPIGWLAGDTSCYLFGHNQMSYTQAENFCRQHSGHLVELNTKHEDNFIKDRLRDMKGGRWWMGITDEVTEGEWKWVQTGLLTNYTDWGPGEPNPNKNEDCAMMYVDDDFQWADVSCTADDIRPICEKSAT